MRSTIKIEDGGINVDGKVYDSFELVSTEFRNNEVKIRFDDSSWSMINIDELHAVVSSSKNYLDQKRKDEEV